MPSSSSHSRWVNGLLVVAIVAVVGLGVWFSGDGSLRSTEDQASDDGGRSGGEIDPNHHSVTRGPLREGERWVGGVKRSATDQPLVTSTTSTSAVDSGDSNPDIEALKKSGIQLPIPELIGSTPPVKADANPSVAAAMEALKSGTHPERLTPMLQGKAFDPRKYENDKQYRERYLEVVEAGRVFQTAQPGKDVPRLRRVTKPRKRIFQDGSVALKVRAIAGAPVTFTSFDLGRFANKLTSITVQAGDDGHAVAEFFGAPGTINDVNILAGSPVTSGQVRFVVQVDLPEAEATSLPGGVEQ